MFKEHLLDELDHSIRQGNLRRVVSALSRVRAAKVDPSQKLRLANLCRRAGLIPLGLRLLEPLVIPIHKNTCSPTPKERAEYGVLLHRSGAIECAMNELFKCDKTAAPEANLYLAFCYFSRWDHRGALAPLKEYLATPLNSYDRTVGLVNLTAAYVELRMNEQADECFAELDSILKSKGHLRLRGNTLELRAQKYMAEGQYDLAEKSLNEAAELFVKNDNRDHIWVKKWQAVLAANRTGDPQSLEDFRAYALARRDWESVRDTDFHIIKLRFDQHTFEKLIFGSPYRAYRERVANRIGKSISKESLLIGEAAGSFHLNLIAGTLTAPNTVLKLTPNILCLLTALLSDLYRPASTGHLFSKLYPGEYFSYPSSPARVHQLVYRTRKFFENLGADAKIVQKSDTYKLIFGPGIAITIPLHSPKKDPKTNYLDLLKKRLGEKSIFKAHDAARALDLHPSSTTRFLAWGTTGGHLAKVGKGPATHYRINKTGE